MNMVDASTLLTIIYVLVDDWYQQHGQYHNIYSRLIIPTEMDDLSFDTPQPKGVGILNSATDL